MLTLIIFIFSSCPNDYNRHKVQFFLNEKPIDFEWCNIGLCDLSMVLEKYKDFLNADCASMYCEGSSASYLKLSAVLLSVMMMLRLLF